MEPAILIQDKTFLTEAAAFSRSLLRFPEGKPYPRAATAFLLLSVIILLVSDVPSLSQEVSDAALQPVQAAIRAKDYDRALQLAQSALTRAPDDHRFLTLEGVILTSKGQPQDALAAFLKALRFSPRYLPALEGAAQIEYQTGDRRARQVLLEILTLDPKNETAHAMLGVISEQAGNCKAALGYFQLAGRAVSSSPRSLELYGYCLERLNRPQEAVVVFQQLLALAPDQTSARYDLAVVQLQAGDGNQAVETLAPLLAADHPTADILSLAADAYEAAGDTPRAVALLRQAIVQEPTNENYYLDFAGLAFDHASYQVGVDMLDAGIQRFPESSSLYIARGLLKVQIGDNESADADFKRAEHLDPSRGIGAYTQSLLESEKGDPDMALAKVRAKLKQYPNDALLHFLLADILEKRGATVGTPTFDESLQHARRAVELDPNLSYARNLLSTLYLDAGKNQLAIEQCRAAIKLDPTDQTALYHLIMALRKTGQVSEISSLVERLASVRRENQKLDDYKKRFQIVEHPPGQNN